MPDPLKLDQEISKDEQTNQNPEQPDHEQNAPLPKITMGISTKTFVIGLVTILFLGSIFVLGFNIYLQGSNSPSLAGWKELTSAPLSFDLNLDSPDDESLVFDKSILVSGKTSPNTPILISTDSSDYALESDSSGDFSQTISLALGLNSVNVIAYDSSGNSKNIQRTIYYSQDQI